MEELKKIKQIRKSMIEEIIKLMLIKGIMKSKVMKNLGITRPTLLKLLNVDSINDQMFNDERLAKVLEFCRNYEVK